MTTPQPPTQALPLSAEELQQYITVLGADCYEVEKHLPIKPRCVVEIDMLKRCHAALVARDEELAKLREALAPFANAAECDLAKDASIPDERIIISLPGDVIGLRGGYDLTVGNLRRAAQASNPSTDT